VVQPLADEAASVGVDGELVIPANTGYSPMSGFGSFTSAICKVSTEAGAAPPSESNSKADRAKHRTVSPQHADCPGFAAGCLSITRER
jgi:hypothetical protein